MRQLGNLKFLVIFSILFSINDTSGLRCWRCSSDASNSKFCGDTVDLRGLSEQQKRWSYVECDPKPPNNADNIENLIPKCRILLQHVNDKPTYSRSCYWEQENVSPDSCTVQKYNPSYVKVISCYTCTTDGCNEKFQSAPAPAIAPTPAIAPAEDNEKSSAVMATVSHTIFAIFVLSVVIGH